MSELYNQDWVKYFFSYREDGHLLWKIKPYKTAIPIGSVAGHIKKIISYNKNSYKEYPRRIITVNNKQWLSYRLIWLFHKGNPIPNFVDHEDGNTLNDKISNLRDASRSQNLANQKNLSLDNTSGYTGVIRHRNTNKWKAIIGVNGKLVHLGIFPSKEYAAKRYDEAAVYYFKEFSVSNSERIIK